MKVWNIIEKIPKSVRNLAQSLYSNDLDKVKISNKVSTSKHSYVIAPTHTEYENITFPHTGTVIKFMIKVERCFGQVSNETAGQRFTWKSKQNKVKYVANSFTFRLKMFPKRSLPKSEDLFISYRFCTVLYASKLTDFKVYFIRKLCKWRILRRFASFWHSKSNAIRFSDAIQK